MAHDTASLPHDAADGHDHDHPEFLAHHFDDPEQQFDSGKLGMWLFLVTEVLFFSGMFCAYALYRSRNPEVFTYSSQFLNETLGAFNTGVLLFSSLSMAWGVRCAQLRQRTGLVISLAITLGCASMFLGVKAIEYTHKWDLGLLPAGLYLAQVPDAAHHEGVSPWLYWLSAVHALCAFAFGLWYVVTLLRGDKRRSEIAGPLLVTALCYFLGVFIGIAFESGAAEGHSGESHASASHASGDDSHGHEGDEHTDHDSGEHEGEHQDEGGEPSSVAVSGSGSTAIESSGESDSGEASPVGDGASEGVSSVMQTRLVSASGSPMESEQVIPGATQESELNQRGGAGLFFSIYYCMTGVHAIHILAGMGVLAWLLARATRDQFNEQYFGPVDYVGLYWHLVDLIWIYLFPLLYLIT